MSDQEFIFAPPTVKVDFSLLPVDSIINSLWLLNQADTTSGLGEWVERTSEALTPEQMHLHKTILHVLLSGYEYEEDNPSNFQEYLDRIATEDPYEAQERIIQMFGRKCENYGIEAEREDFLGDRENFMRVIDQSIGQHYREAGKELNLTIYGDGQELLKDPERMHQVVVNHLTMMWNSYLRDEWYRNLPLLEESIAAFKQLDFSGMTPTEVIRSVTGRDLTSFWPELADAERLVFIPSAHIGPYNTFFKRNETMHVIFRARMPEGARRESTALSRSELLVHLNALADDTRLKILELLTHHEELCAQDIINMLELSQSSASRHLRQLTATGFVTERRKDIAKCYNLNLNRIDDTTSALKHFLGG